MSAIDVLRCLRCSRSAPCSCRRNINLRRYSSLEIPRESNPSQTAKMVCGCYPPTGDKDVNRGLPKPIIRWALPPLDSSTTLCGGETDADSPRNPACTSISLPENWKEAALPVSGALVGPPAPCSAGLFLPTRTKPINGSHATAHPIPLSCSTQKPSSINERVPYLFPI